ncbi:MAG: hypothetical protein ACE5FT_02360 [Candidatus Nanoarchaeia archaeon]
MNKRGGIDFWLIVVGAVLALVYLLGTMTPIGDMFGATRSVIDSTKLRVEFLKCPKPADPKFDIDRDGCIDTQDFCVVDKGYLKRVKYWKTDEDVPASLSEKDLCALGNNFCDTDGDFVPDICDKDPQDPKVLCDIETDSFLYGRNKCVRLKKDKLKELGTFKLLDAHVETVKRYLLRA